MSKILSVKLSNFRSYESAEINSTEGLPVVITGKNGAGKTNILEAVSLLSAGKGIRSAKYEELQNRYSNQPWAIYANVQTAENIYAKIGTGAEKSNFPENRRNQRTIRINGENAKSQSALNDYVITVWLTPQMDRIMYDGSASRRKFFDKMISTIDPAHSGRIQKYENAMSQRSRLLKNNEGDDIWLKALECRMSESAIAIAAARNDYALRLQQAINNADSSEIDHFPKSLIDPCGDIEKSLQKKSAIEVEEEFKKTLISNRKADSITGGSASGIHKSDWSIIYKNKNMPAEQCSTGEQKSMLIGIVLAHARLIKAEKAITPILLMDEIAAHLDHEKRSALFNTLLNMQMQFFITGTDESIFSELDDKSVKYSIYSHLPK